MPDPSARDSYLEAKILTASQPQLQRILLESAIRYGRQAQQAWGLSAPEAEPQLDKALNLVEALVHGVTKGKTEISNRFEEQYAFLYRELAACRIDQDVERLDVVLSLLEYERETWKQACELCEADDKHEQVLPVSRAETRQPESVASSPVSAPLGGNEFPANHGRLSLEG
jgi:flagellar biosynthetic protein FliS